MKPNRSHTLGGEGCPAADITNPAQNRNNLEALPSRALHVRAGSSRTVQERSGPVGTAKTQEPEFPFTVHSPCPAGGWNGMPDSITVATVADCLAHGVCGCDLGDAVRNSHRE